MASWLPCEEREAVRLLGTTTLYPEPTGVEVGISSAERALAAPSSPRVLLELRPVRHSPAFEVSIFIGKVLKGQPVSQAASQREIVIWAHSAQCPLQWYGAFITPEKNGDRARTKMHQHRRHGLSWSPLLLV